MYFRAYLLLIVTTLCWGANAVAGKLAVSHVSPFLLTSMRWGFAFVIAGAFAVPHLKADRPEIRRHLPLLASYGAIGFALFNATFYTAVHYTSAINIVIIQAGMPLIIFAANFALFRTRITGAQFVGFLLTLCGVALVASHGNPSALLRLGLNRGDALMLLAICFYGSYTVALRWRPAIHWLSFITVLAAAAFVASLPFTAFEIARGTVTYPDLTGWLVGLFTAIVPGIISQACFVQGTAMIGSNRSGLFVNLVPIFGTILSILVLAEVLHSYHAIALALVMAGIGLAERRRSTPHPT